MSMTAQKTKNKIWLILLVASTFIIIICNGKYMPSKYTLNNIMDEYAYICVGAYFAGYDWSSLTSLWSAYYSYGYPIILAVFFMMFDNFTLVYYASMTINLLFLLGSFYLSVIIFKKLFCRISDFFIIAGCLSATLYSANLINTKWIWPETTILFLFWLCSYLLLKLTESFNMKRLIFLILILSTMYIMHQRTLVISIAAFIYLIIIVLGDYKFKFEKNIFIKSGVIVFVLLFVFILLRLVKSYVMSNIYGNSGSMNVNNIGGIANSLASSFNLLGLKSFIEGFTGKLFYFIYGTVFIGCFGCWYCIKRTWIVLRGVVRKEKDKSEEQLKKISLFFLLTFIGMFLLSVIFMMGGGYSRHDTLIYGRYMEYTYGPLLVLGFYELYTNRNKWKIFTILTGIGITTALIVSFVWGHGTETYYKSMFSSSIVYYFFYSQNLLLEHIPFLVMKIRSVIFILILILLGANKCQEAKRIKIIFVMFVCSGIWIFNALQYNESAYVVQNNYAEMYNTQVESLKRVGNINNVFVIYDDEDIIDLGSDVTQIKRLQVLLGDIRVTPIKLESLNTIEMLESGSVYFTVKTADYYSVVCNFFSDTEMIINDSMWRAFWVK